MGLGKTYTALGAAVYLKWLAQQAAENRPLSCFDQQKLNDMQNPPTFFRNLHLIQRPILVVVLPAVISEWANAIRQLTKNTSLKLNIIYGNRQLGPADINVRQAKTEDEKVERGSTVYLITYQTLRHRYEISRTLRGTE
jgi:hypothetical protein